jgi:hypothetical protein
MEELFELRTAIEEHRYADALRLIEEMEEMSRDEKINKIDNYAIILLLHLIKQQAENRTTRSWDLSIYNAVRQIKRTNKRRKSGGDYLSPGELQGIIAEAYLPALKMAALEAFEGQYTEDQLAEKVDREDIEKQALDSIIND